jgi:hypothetical protein
MSKQISVSRVIPAPAQKIFDLLADPKMHTVIDGSGTVKRSNPDNPERLSLGAKFSMGMQRPAPYPITNTVSEFEEGRRIGWHHFANNVWRYELEPVDGGTKVTETFDFSKGRFGPVVRIFLRRNRPGMERTLERIEQHLASQRA